MHTNISQGHSHHTLCEAILQLVKATQHKKIGDKTAACTGFLHQYGNLERLPRLFPMDRVL